MIGCHSARDIEKHHKALVAKTGYGVPLSRDTIFSLLNETRVVEHLSLLSFDLFNRLKAMRHFRHAESSWMTVALIDGVDLGDVHDGHGKCELCLSRKVGDETHYYHRVVVISVMSMRGPQPLFFRFCRPQEVSLDPFTVSEERFKSDCELSCSKQLLNDVAERYGGRLPFDILAGDALNANAPMMELVESLGSLAVIIYKQESRKLYKEAKADFGGGSLGFGVREKSWNKDPSGRGRVFEAKWNEYTDLNRKGVEKRVKVFETTRTEASGKKATTMAITSSSDEITPELVEQVRYAKWSNLENGVFNELTNNWKTLKHTFCHKSNAMIAMLYMQFLALIIYNCFTRGHLTRGGKRFEGTLKDFFKLMIISFYSSRPATLIEAHANAPP